MKNLKRQYRNLEMKVHRALRDKIESSTRESEHIQAKCILVEHLEMKELAIVHDHLTFLDEYGYHYSVWSEATLENLIDILQQKTK